MFYNRGKFTLNTQSDQRKFIFSNASLGKVTTTSAKSQSDNTVLWNSPSLGKITAIDYPRFYKTTPFLSFEGKKQGQTHLFFLV